MSQERFTETTQAPGSDASSTQGKTNGSGEDHVGATFLNDPLTVNSSTNITNSNSDGVHTPKLYSYVLTTGNMINVSNQGTICSKDTSTMTGTNISDEDKALAVERSNMRFHQMLAKLNSVENIHSFEVTSETVPPDTGVPTASSTFTITYLRQPIHPNQAVAAGANTVERLAAEGVQFDDENATQMRHVWKPYNVVAVGTNPEVTGADTVPQIVVRENVTANKFATNVLTMVANMSCTTDTVDGIETPLNPTHSLP